MNRFAQVCDEFSLNLSVNTHIDLPSSRETLLHYFEQVRKRFPELREFSSREAREYWLQEPKVEGRFRWTSVEPRQVSVGHVNPDTTDETERLIDAAMEIATYAFSLGTLDCESLQITLAFEYNYRGNQHALVAEALGMLPAQERLAEIPGAYSIGYRPSIMFALDPEAHTRARLTVEPRTTVAQIQAGDYGDEQICVYLTAWQVGGLELGAPLGPAARRLARLCFELADDYVLEQVLRPLRQAIALR